MHSNHKLILPYELPENLESLYKHEENIRKQSTFEINKTPELVDHLELIHASLDILYNLTKYYKNRTDDELTIQLLGTRLFNSVVSSLKLLLAGYYQNSFALQRDILETGFLLDFFSIDLSKISDWKNSSNEKRLSKYGPGAIRKELHKRDKFHGDKRRQVYQQMCEYAVHPTYPGFALLTTKGLFEIGPFFDPKSLKSALEGLAMYTPNFTMVYIGHFDRKCFPRAFLQAYMDFIDRIKSWSKKYFGVDLSRFNTDEIRELLKQS